MIRDAQLDSKRNSTMSEAFQRILDRLEGVRSTSNPMQKQALCPAHDDTDPSLGINWDGEKVKLNCFAGCLFEDVLAAIGLEPKDCYDNPLQAPTPKEYAKPPSP